MISPTVQQSNRVQKASGVDMPLQMKDVLVIGDSKSTRALVVNSINGYKDFNIIEAETGEEAYDKIRKNQVKLIFLDFNMPRLNGLEFLNKMRALVQYKTTPVIVLTSESENSSLRQNFPAGTTVHVTKPFQAENLLKIVEAMRFWHVK